MTYQITLTANKDTLTADLVDTLPLGLTYVNGSVSGGASYDSGQILFNGPVTPGSPIIITYQTTVNHDVTPGSVLYNTALATGAEQSIEAGVAVAIPDNSAVHTLVLINAFVDNDLAQHGLEVLNSAEMSAHNPNAVVLMLLDGPEADDAYLYQLDPDQNPACPNYTNPTCGGRYVLGQNMWSWGDNVASPYSLAEFLRGGVRAYPNAQQVVVSLVGHGGGWSPQVLAGQPGSGRKASEDPLGGFGWDKNPGSSLSTPALAQALRWSLPALQETGKTKYGLLYLDACLMAAAEVAYEVRDSVEYVLASESWSWTTRSYQYHIADIDGVRGPREIGQHWLKNEAHNLRRDDYPFTFSLIDTSEMDALLGAENDLAAALITALPTKKAQIETAFKDSDCFDSNQNGMIEHDDTLGWADNYCDLATFAQQLKKEFYNHNTVKNAAQAVIEAVNRAVVSEDHHNSTPWNYSDQLWVWGKLGGLHKYLPLLEDDWKRHYYTGSHLQAPADGQWDEFLTSYWDNIDPPAIPTCPPDCELPPAPLPIAPIEAHAQAIQNKIFIEWQDDIAAVDKYQLYRQKDGGSFSQIASIDKQEYKDSHVTKNHEYCYQIKAINDANSVIGVSNISCIHFGLTLWIPDQTVLSGATDIVVPVNLANADALCIGAMVITIEYDPNIVTANGRIDPTIYTHKYNFAAVNTSGKIMINIDGNCHPIHGSGSLFHIGFDVTGDQDEMSYLDFIRGLSGTVIYDDADLINPVALELKNGSLTIGSSYKRGDVNGDGVINPADARLAQKIASHKIIPSPQQRNACDVTGNGECDSADATIIRCYALTQDWNKCGGKDDPLSQLANTIVNGDSANTVSNEPVQVTVSEVSGAPGETITVPIDITNPSGFAGADFNFTYDPAKMTATGASLTAFTSQFQIESNTSEAGVLYVSISSNTAIDTEGSIIELEFTIISQATPVMLTEIDFNDTAGRDFETSDLQQSIVINNPTGDETTIFLPLITR